MQLRQHETKILHLRIKGSQTLRQVRILEPSGNKSLNLGHKNVHQDYDTQGQNKKS